MLRCPKLKENRELEPILNPFELIFFSTHALNQGFQMLPELGQNDLKWALIRDFRPFWGEKCANRRPPHFLTTNPVGWSNFEKSTPEIFQKNSTKIRDFRHLITKKIFGT